MARMNDDDLLRYLNDEAQEAYQYQEEQAQDRSRSMREYLRGPYGNEEEGRSAVIASDVFDAVEGMLPDLVEVFVSSDKAVVFEPVGPEDVDGAEQATNACNYVFYKQNPGFFLLYNAAKDALLLRTGGVKWWYDKRRTPTFTTYRGVDEMQLAVFLTTNPKAEVVEKDEVEPTPEELAQAQAAGMEPARRYTVKIKTVTERGTVKLANIPPAELRVSPRHNSILLDDCPYVAHVVEKTLSEIRELGHDVDVSDVRASQNEEPVTDTEQRNGWRWDQYEDPDSLDESMVRGWLREEYVLVDFDGDGIAERRRIVRLGQKILANDECSHVQIAAWTPYILSHRFDGLSVADLVSDFQRISTEIVRQQLDNLYLANNQETVVLTDAQGNPQANIDDLLNRRPGGVIRERVAGAVRPYQERWQGIEAMPMMEMLQSAKENRTGYTRYSQGLDANSLNKTATGVSMIMNASQKRMKLMARIMAEALVAPMFKGIFKTLTDYCMDKVSFRLNGKFVQYDPQEWRDGYDMSINVGIGTGDVQQQQMFLMQMAQSQAMAMQSPLAGRLVTPKNLFNLQAKLAENAGFKNPAEFWTDPDTVPPQPPQPNPMVQVEQAKLQNEVQKTQAQMQMKAQESQAELELKAQIAQMERDQALQIEQMRLAAKEREKAMEIAAAQGRQVVLSEDGVMQDAPPAQEVLMSQVAQSLALLAQAISAPKQVIRDETGRAVGVAPVGVN
jgi:hypothetical protein